MLLKFINRFFELSTLNKAYKSSNSEFFVIYGRRRIGKTELIKKFAHKKNHFYFLAKKQDLKLEVERFRKKISEKFNIYLRETDSFEELIKEILSKINFKKKFILIIDEFPYWLLKNESVLYDIQQLWDELLKDKNIFLILCGSYISIMEEKVLEVRSPLYGRRTGQLKIEPMNIKCIKEFLPSYNIEDIIKVYGAVGTVPFYLKEMNDKIDFMTNIKNTFLDKANILNQEAYFLLREELREVNVYFNILKTITDGATKLSEISTKSRVDITNINKYLKVLTSLKLVKKEKPITASDKEKKYLYKLSDNYYGFWLKYVYTYEEEIEEDNKTVLKIIEKDYKNYLGSVFEDFCKKLIRKMKLKINKTGLKIGSWWYKDKQIDIVAVNESTKEILFAECKWKEKINAERIFEELKNKAKHVSWNNKKRKEHYLIFAKSFNKKIKNCYDLSDIEKILFN